MEFDILIKNAKIIDGTGNPWFFGDLGVMGDKISFVGYDINNKGKVEIDASGKVLSPGFIDSHTHFDLGPFKFIDFEDHYSKRRLAQGITTQVTGCCGNSPAPLTKENREEWLLDDCGDKVDKVNWLSFKEYLDELDKCQLGTNMASYVGHGTIRYNVLGFSDKLPNDQEMKEMQEIAKQAMEDGAIGISTGLIYPPGVFSDTKELVDLCSALRDYKGLYASHMRSESADFINSIKEVIEISEKNNIPGQIHHIKTKHKNSKEMIKEGLGLIEDARKRNVDIAFDLYPYEASWTGLTQVLPSWTFEGGHKRTVERIKDESLFDRIFKDIYADYRWETLEDEWEGSKLMLVLNGLNCEAYAGKTIYEIAKELNLEPIKAIIKVLLDTDLSVSCAFFGMKDEDIKTFLKSPYCMIGSDSIASKVNRSVHPRNNGTFPRILGKYAREENAISMEEAVNKMTGYTAQRFNFSQRGLIKEGFFADLVIFDENTVIDKATYMEPFNKPDGIDYVIVNGCITIEKGEFTGKTKGRVLRRK